MLARPSGRRHRAAADRELVWQMRGEAGERQIEKRPKVTMAQNQGGLLLGQDFAVYGCTILEILKRERSESEGYDVSKKRKEVVKSIEDAAALIKDGQTVAIGGFGADNHPMAIVREIIRTGKKNLTIVASATAGLEIDLLIGAGCVKKLDRALCRPGNVLPDRPQLPKIRRVRPDRGDGDQRIPPLCRLLCRGFGPGILRLARRRRHQHSSSSTRISSSSSTRSARPRRLSPCRRCGRTGRSFMSAGRMSTATASISARVSATAGWRAPSNRIMTQTERIVPNSVIRKNPFMTTIAYADVVVEAPYGGHPYAAHGFYKEDVEFIQDYVKCSEANRKGDIKTWDDYLKRHVRADTTTISRPSASRSCSSLYTHPIVSW